MIQFRIQQAAFRVGTATQRRVGPILQRQQQKTTQQQQIRSVFVSAEGLWSRTQNNNNNNFNTNNNEGSTSCNAIPISLFVRNPTIDSIREVATLSVANKMSRSSPPLCCCGNYDEDDDG